MQILNNTRYKKKEYMDRKPLETLLIISETAQDRHQGHSAVISHNLHLPPRTHWYKHPKQYPKGLSIFFYLHPPSLLPLFSPSKVKPLRKKKSLHDIYTIIPFLCSIHLLIYFHLSLLLSSEIMFFQDY